MEVGTCRPVDVIDPLVPKLRSGSELECAGIVGALVAEDDRMECDSEETVLGEPVEGGSECDDSDCSAGRRKQLLRELLRSELEESVLTGVERDQLCSLLLEFHEVFSLEKGERGEQERWVPFAVRR